MDTTKIFRPAMMLPADAAVYVDEGVLVVNFEKPGRGYGHHCREVMVRHDEMGISVVGKRVSWAWNDGPEVAEFIARRVDINQVLPEYHEIVTINVRMRFMKRIKEFFTLKPYGVYVEEKIALRVKPGWVELKDTNILFHKTSNNYRIIWKNPS